jgi:uncharacterized cupin superfamily protein
MKIFSVADKVHDTGEYLLGSRITGSHACYLIYGVLQPGEEGRELSPGKGHEEIVLALSGDLYLCGASDVLLRQGEAAHIQGEETYRAANRGSRPAVYVIAGGHAGHGHH